MKRSLLAIVLVAVSSTVVGIVISSLMFVLMLPTFEFTGLLITCLIGVLLLLFCSVPIMAQQFIDVFIDSTLANVLLSLMATAIVWIIAQRIIAWSMDIYGADGLSSQGYRLLRATPLIGLAAGWLIILIRLFQTTIQLPQRRR